MLSTKDSNIRHQLLSTKDRNQSLEVIYQRQQFISSCYLRKKAIHHQLLSTQGNALPKIEIHHHLLSTKDSNIHHQLLSIEVRNSSLDTMLDYLPKISIHHQLLSIEESNLSSVAVYQRQQFINSCYLLKISNLSSVAVYQRQQFIISCCLPKTIIHHQFLSSNYYQLLSTEDSNILHQLLSTKDSNSSSVPVYKDSNSS